MNGVAIAHVNQLAGATQIETLRLQDMHIDSLAPLASMSELRTLAVERVAIDDGGGAELPQVTSLILREMPQSSLDAVSGTPNLEQIALREMRADNLTPLSQLRSLNRVEIRAETAPDLSPLLQIETLTAIDLNVRAPSLPAARLCAERPGLREIRYIGATDIADLSIFAPCQDLRALEVSADTATSLAPLAGRTSLQRLAVTPSNPAAGTVPITDLSPLANLTSLTHLSLRGVRARDFSVLANLRNLESLELSDTELSSLDFVRNMPNLRVLRIHGTRVSDLRPIAGATQLEYLDIGDTQVRDISALANLVRLKTFLSLRAPIRDRSVLDRLPLLYIR